MYTVFISVIRLDPKYLYLRDALLLLHLRDLPVINLGGDHGGEEDAHHENKDLCPADLRHSDLRLHPAVAGDRRHCS